MDQFIHRANLDHYRRILGQTTDEAERQRILKLLVEEAKGRLPSERHPVYSAGSVSGIRHS